jgi:hypothetical protein
MAEFRATPDDLAEIIAIRVRQTVKSGVAYPAASLAVAVGAWWFVPEIALVALGACGAWSLSLWREAKNVREAYLWRYAWLQEGISLRIGADGVEWTSPRGVALTRWNDDLSVLRLNTCFVLDDEGEDIAVIPRRYLDSTELALLTNRCSETVGKGTREAG